MRLYALLALALLIGCKKAETAPAATPAAGTAASQSASGARAQPPDPGPALTARTGRPEAKKGADITVTASAHEVKGGHVIIAAPLPQDIGSQLNPSMTPDLRALLPASARGMAVVEPPTNAAPMGQLLVRLVGTEPPATLDLTLAELPDRWGRFLARPWTLRTVKIEAIAKSPARKDLEPTFWVNLASFFERWDTQGWGSRAPFAGFAQGRAARLGGGTGAAADAIPVRDRSGDVAETMSLYTGMTSIQEALQADRGLRLRGAPGPRDIPIADLKPVPLAAHPWDAMMTKLGKQPVMEPMASVVPARMMYLHFKDLRVAVQLANDLSTWLQPAAELIEGNTGTSRMAERYERQLVVERTGLAEKLGHLASDGTAFIAGDPFFREGTDVAILFKVKNRTLLTTALAGFEASARARRSDLGDSTYEISGHTVRRLSTPDREYDQHRVELGDILILANSRATIEALVAVADKKEKSLAESGDFKTFRTMDPFGPDEDGYAFLSDDFVAHAISPATKVLASRRMLAGADLRTVGYAALLHGWLEGETPSLEGLVKAGYLAQEELKHQDGTPILLATTGPSSTTWGRLGAMTPLSELRVDTVTAEEKQAFEDFARTYQDYWRGTIDPVGIRIKRSADGKALSLDGRMLPLIANTEYDSILETVGMARIDAQVMPSGIRWMFGIGDKASARRELDGLGRMMGRSDLEFGWLGTWVEVGALDRSGLWDLVLLDNTLPQPEGEDSFRWSDPKTFEAISRLPLWAGAHVKSQLGLAATLTAIKATVSMAAPDLVVFDDGGTYRDVSVVTIKPSAKGASMERGLDKLALHYATPADRIVVSLDRPTLEAAIDAALDGKGPKALEPTATEGAQAMLTVGNPSAESWLGKAVLGLLEREARDAFRGAYRDAEVLLRGLPGVAPGSEAWDQAALGFLGSIPASAHGGTFTMEGPLVAHSLYGSEASPAFPVVPVEGSPVTELARSLESVSFGIAFEGEGDFRGLRAKVSWSRR